MFYHFLYCTIIDLWWGGHGVSLDQREAMGNIKFTVQLMLCRYGMRHSLFSCVHQHMFWWKKNTLIPITQHSICKLLSMSRKVRNSTCENGGCISYYCRIISYLSIAESCIIGHLIMWEANVHWPFFPCKSAYCNVSKIGLFLKCTQINVFSCIPSFHLISVKLMLQIVICL